MDVIEQRAVAVRRLLAERRHIQQPTGREIQIIEPGGHRRDLRQRGFESQFTQDDCAVRRDLYPCPDLGQLRRPLQYNRLDPVAPQGQGRRQSTYTATYDDYLHEVS